MDNVMYEWYMEANTDEKMAIVADWLSQLVWGSLSNVVLTLRPINPHNIWKIYFKYIFHIMV